MKRYRMWFVLLLVFAIGCGNSQTIDEEQPTETPTKAELPKQEETLEQEKIAEEEKTPKQNEREEQIYTSTYLENIDDIAIPDDGRLYAVYLQELEQGYKEVKGKELLVINKPSQWLLEFASSGECVCVGEMISSPGEVMALEWEDDFLYMVIPGIDKMPVLYQVNQLSAVYSEEVETYKKITEANVDFYDSIQEMNAFSNLDMWNLQELYCFDMFSEINRLVFMGDRVYVHGILKNPEEKPLVQNLEYVETYPDTYKGQAIGYMDMKNLDAGVTLLPVDVPQDMIKLTEDTLGIYQMGEDATYFWKYTPAEEKWEQTDIAVDKYSETAEESASYGAFSGYEDGCFYVKNGNCVCYKTVDGIEQELFDSDGFVHGLKTNGTFLYYYSYEWSTKEVRSIRISDLLENKTE